MNFSDSEYKDKGIKNLLEAKEIFDSLDMPFFLSNGTLLGAIRDKDFIAHDTDIDLGVCTGDYTPVQAKKLLDAFLKKGFTIYGIYGSYAKGYQFSLKNRDIKLDIFFYDYEHIGDSPVMTMSVWQSGKRFKYVYPYFHARTLTVLHGESFFVPDNYKEYLEAQYGPEWKIPVVDWNCYTSPKNIEHE